MDYIDFIDSPAIREHLRRLPPLPPAMLCILIAQSGCCSLEDKLDALVDANLFELPDLDELLNK